MHMKSDAHTIHPHLWLVRTLTTGQNRTEYAKTHKAKTSIQSATMEAILIPKFTICQR